MPNIRLLAFKEQKRQMIKSFFVAAPPVIRIGEKFSLETKMLGDVYGCPLTCYYPNQTVPQQKGRFNLLLRSREAAFGTSVWPPELSAF